MTKKDYIRIAAALKSAWENIQFSPAYQATGATGRAAARATLETSAICMAATLADENDKFDRARFLAACGVAS